MTGRNNFNVRGISLRALLLMLIALGVCPSPAMGAPEDTQTAAGSVAGTVLDSTGGVIPGATVTLQGVGGSSELSTITDDVGEFAFPFLAMGEYEVVASFPGFDSAPPQRVVVENRTEARVELVLTVGGLVSTASVEAEKVDIAGQGKLVPIEKPIEVEPPFLQREQFESKPFLRGRITSDWYGLNSGGSFFSQISNRLRLSFGAHPGEGWTWNFDGRHRASLTESARNRVILYDANITYDDYRNPVFASIGQMNLYDNAGIGELLGGQVGYKFGKSFRAGAYGGFRPDFYGSGVDPEYHKYGFFARYQGAKAQSFSVSFNELRYRGSQERRFLYFSGLLPIRDRATVFGNVEYELGNLVRSQDRLSRVFLSGRFDVSRYVDVLASYSSGKGLDFHRYLIERSQDLLQNDSELERFYYNTQYGLRVRFKVGDRLRLYVGQRQSMRQDANIANQTTQLGFSVSDLADSGLSFYVNYNLNRGDRSESDSVYASISRTFGRVAWTASYSNLFNGLRFDQLTTTPEIVHLPNRHTFSNEFFITINRTFAISVEHEHSFLGLQGEDLFFVRFLMRM